MKTLSAAKACQNLGEWIDRAIRGEDIGIVHGGKVVALRPVETSNDDYAWNEYGFTKEEIDRSAKKVMAEIKKERKEGKLKSWKPPQGENDRFADECAKLDPKLEQAMAEEGLSEDFAAWPKY